MVKVDTTYLDELKKQFQELFDTLEGQTIVKVEPTHVGIKFFFDDGSYLRIYGGRKECILEHSKIDKTGFHI